MTARVLVAAADPGRRHAFRDAFAEVADVEVVATVDGAEDLGPACDRHRPEVVVLDDGPGPATVLELARALLAEDPTLAVVLWAEADTPEVLATALEAGGRAVLTRPLAIEDASARLLVAAEWSRRLRRTGLGDDPDRPGRGLLVAVAGAKGGVGTSTLALQLARRSVAAGRATVVVDLDLASPDLAGLLDVGPPRSVLDLVPVADHLDERYLADALHRHRTGIEVLVGPTHGERADELDEPATRRILAALRTHAPVVVADCGSRLDDATAVALEVADHAVLVVTPDVPCLLAARRQLAAWARLSIRAEDRLLAVVNRRSKHAEIGTGVVARTLGVEVAEPAIPDRPRAFRAAADDADPTAVDDRGVRRSLERLARSLDLLAPPPLPPPLGRDPASTEATPPSRRPRPSRRPPAGADVLPRLLRARRAAGERGQVAVEALGLALLIATTVLVLWQAVLTGTTVLLAGRAADRAARVAAAHRPAPDALDRGRRDGVATLPGPWRDGATTSFEVDGRQVTATVQVEVPLVVPGWLRLPLTVSGTSGARS